MFQPVAPWAVTKLATHRDAIPDIASDLAHGKVTFVRESAGGVFPGFPIGFLRGVLDDDNPTYWAASVAGVYRLTSWLTRSDASTATFLQHQIRFRELAPGDDLPAFDSCAEAPPEFTGVVSGFTPSVTWIGYLRRFDLVAQVLAHDAPGTIDARGSLTIEYLGTGHNTAAADPWGPFPASAYPTPAGTTYGPP